MKTPFDMIKFLQKILNIKMLYLAARFVLLVWAAVGISAVLRQNSPLFVLLFVIVTLLILLDIGRLCLPFVGRHSAAFLILSITLCLLFFTARRADMVQIYYFFLLHDIFTIQKGKVPKALVAFHFAGFMGAEGYAIFVTEHEIFRHGFSDIIVVFVCYALILLIFAWIHYFKWERERLKVLNANLIEYSFQEREYLLAKERGSISQELHDSLGHSLMAVVMNVQYLKAIQGKSQEEKDKQLDEIENLLKECVTNLRSSVYSLRELDKNINLREEIQCIIQKFDELGLVRIGLDYDSEADKAPGHVKEVIHKAIREGITNSIRHGSASSIQISIHCREDGVELVIEDNGSGCADIHKSFGLSGIMERVEETGGEISFTSAKNKGFTIRATLPGGIET